MWSSLKSDFAELVSTVQEDTVVVMERVEATQQQKKQTAAQKEAERRMNLQETYTVPLLWDEEVQDVNEREKTKKTQTKKAASTSSSDAGSSTESNNNNNLETDDHEEEESAAAAAFLNEQDQQEVARIEEFLAEFDIEAQTAAISDLLDEHPDTLKQHFERLVPAEISYADFWRRFFYRCHADRIAAEWDRDEERARLQRAQLVQKVSGVLGGAAKAVATGVAKAVATGVANALTEDDEGRAGQAAAPGAAAVTALSQARPPFVLNTAVDEDEGEEEELGWDDDDDEDDDGEYLSSSAGIASGFSSSNVSAAANEEEETVEFKDEPLERATEQLKQAIEERDQLHQTVELQKQELVHLKLQQQRSASDGMGGGDGGGGEALEEVEQLRAQLKEKDADLQAATDESTSVVHVQQQLQNALLEKKAAVTKLEATQQEWKQTLEKLQAENAALKRTATERQAELAATQEQNSTLQSELQAVQARLVTAENSVATLKKDLDSTKDALRRASSEGGEGHSGETPSTVSTGVVKVDKPAVVSKIVDVDDDDEGWGDDWD